MSEKSVCIIGLPSSGKTTFLAALGCFFSRGSYRNWNVRETETAEYFQEIGEKWSRCEEMNHTSTDTREEITVTFHNNNTGNVCKLKMPDRAGEFFKRSFRTDVREREFQKEIRNSDRILVFINPDKFEKEPLIGNLRYNVKKYVGEVPDEDSEDRNIRKSEDEAENKTDDKNGDTNKNKNENENARNLGTIRLDDSAENVELLQSIVSAYRFGEMARVTIVVSAWDVFEYQAIPECVIKKEVPLLWQFLRGNRDRLEVDYVGVSAQGGRWDSEENREKIIKKPWKERLKAVDSDGNEIKDILEIMM